MAQEQANLANFTACQSTTKADLVSVSFFAFLMAGYCLLAIRSDTRVIEMNGERK